METIEAACFKRCVVGLTAEEAGLSLAEGKELLAELQRLMLQTQRREYAVCKRVCPECLKLRRQRDCRTRTVQTLFGTVVVDAWRCALAPKHADYSLKTMRAALVEQGRQRGGPLTVMSDGEAALPTLVRAATGEPVRHILDWSHLSMRVRPIEQVRL